MLEKLGSSAEGCTTVWPVLKLYSVLRGMGDTERARARAMEKAKGDNN